MKIELVAKTIVFNADGQLLVLKRHDNDEHRPGHWDLPGGQVDLGEHPQDAAIREAYEETGLVLAELRSIHVASRIYDACQVIKTVYTTTHYSGRINLSDEHSAYRWVSVDAFNKMDISGDYKIAVSMVQNLVSIPG